MSFATNAIYKKRLNKLLTSLIASFARVSMIRETVAGEHIFQNYLSESLSSEIEN